MNAQGRRTKIERDALGRVIKQVVPRRPSFGDAVPNPDEIEFAYELSAGY